MSKPRSFCPLFVCNDSSKETLERPQTKEPSFVFSEIAFRQLKAIYGPCLQLLKDNPVLLYSEFYRNPCATPRSIVGVNELQRALMGDIGRDSSHHWRSRCRN